MSYLAVADMAEDHNLNRRMTAAAAQEEIQDPDVWVRENRWYLASQPGWDAAWDSAVASGNDDPGSDASVITDGMILSAVQAISLG